MDSCGGGRRLFALSPCLSMVVTSVEVGMPRALATVSKVRDSRTMLAAISIVSGVTTGGGPRLRFTAIKR